MNTFNEVDSAYEELVKAVKKKYIYLKQDEKDFLINEIGSLITKAEEKNERSKRRKEKVFSKRIHIRKSY